MSSSQPVLNIGVSSLVSIFHELDDCEANGLPRLPNSVNIVGRLQDLKNLCHPRLCRYLDARRNKHERVIVVAEHFSRSLHNTISNHFNGHSSPPVDSKLWFFQILEGLVYLHNHRVVHHNLHTKNILLDDSDSLRLSAFGLYYMTGCGQEVKFPIGSPNYTAPEVFIEWCMKDRKANGSNSNNKAAPLTTAGVDPRRDMWSLGMIGLEILIGKNIFHDDSVESVLKRLLDGLKSGQSFWDYFGINDFVSNVGESDLDLVNIIKNCLSFNASERPTSTTLLKHRVFEGIPHTPYFERDMFDITSRLHEVNSLNGFTDLCIDMNSVTKSEYHLLQRPPDEIYHYWSLAGGDLEALLRDAHLVKQVPPILTMPIFIENEGREHLSKSSLYFSPDYDDTVIPLPACRLFDRVSRISPKIFYPLLDNLETIEKMEDHGQAVTYPPTLAHRNGFEASIVKQPISVKERDIEYQIRRIVLFDRLLRAYPYKFNQFWVEARQDIPPLLRGPVWAALLKVGPGARERFASIDMSSLDEKSANQIGVDLPRCHSYDELLVSPTGQQKMRRVLTGWLLTHPQYEYTQGMDSLAAIFLRLNFNKEYLALASLDAFIDKYMYNIFSPGTEPLHEYYGVVQQLMSFHNAQLSTFFNNINVSLTGFTASWIYTMFAHSFPVHKTMQLWDTFLLGNSSFPMFIFLAIIHQLNQQFNFAAQSAEDIFTLFSNFPEVNIHRIREDALRFFCVTPRSLTIRSHDNPLHMSQDPLGIQPLSLQQLNFSMAPRISGEDLLMIMDYKISRQSSSGDHTSPNRLALIPDFLILDIRSRDEFAKACISGSLNVPHTTAFNESGQLVHPAGVTNSLARCRKHIKIVVNTSDDSEAVRFADRLVRSGVNRVCILQGGIDILRGTDRLVLPQHN